MFSHQNTRRLTLQIRDDLKSVLHELSSILAGFKLALIVISYFGFGSFAKWIIDHWYPFTRWVWDYLCSLLYLPPLQDVVKDSLTALVFFLPLGLTALAQSRKSIDLSEPPTLRVLGTIFGIFFVALICKDVLFEIAQAVSKSSGQFNFFLIELIAKISSQISEVPTGVYAFTTILYFASAGTLLFYIRRNPHGLFSQNVRRLSRNALRTSAILLGALSLLVTILGFFASLLSSGNFPSSIFISAAILLLIMALLAAAITYTPKKLLVTTGAAFAFIFTALSFEFILVIIGAIERVSSN